MQDIVFRFDEFDEAIDEAIEDDIKEADGGGMGFFTYSIFIKMVTRKGPVAQIVLCCKRQWV